MARKFSLKDNPIFQRLEIPQRRPSDSSTSDTEEQDLFPSSDNISEEKIDPQNLTLKNRPLKIDPNGPYGRNDRETAQALVANSQSQNEEKVRGHKASVEASLSDLQSLEYSGSENLPVEQEQSDNSPIFEDQNLTLKNIPSDLSAIPSSERDTRAQEVALLVPPQSSTPPNLGEEEHLETQVTSLSGSEQESETTGNRESLSSATLNDSQLGLKENIEKALFFGFYNEVSDNLLPTLETAEQVLYSRLFRLSYGFNRNYCTVSQPLLQERTGLSRNTVRTGLQSLLKKKLLAVVDSGNHISTTYRVFLPREQSSGSNFDPQKQTLKNRPSNFEGQSQRFKSRGSKYNRQEGQNLDVQILPLKKKNGEKFSKNETLSQRRSNIDPQNLTPLLFTNNILTLSSKTREFDPEKNNSQFKIAKSLVETFYSKLSQSPTTEKLTRGINDCNSLLEQGFSDKQIINAIEWILNRHPDTGSFSRVTHLIDQALKAREQDEQKIKKEQERKAEEERKTSEERKVIEDEIKIEEIKTSMTQPELDSLVHQARQLVESEQGNIRFGRETLVQLKLRQLIRERFL